MFDILGKYQAVIFVNMADIVPSADTIPAFLEMFRDKNFLPNTFQEIGPLSPRPMPRLRLLSQDGEWTIQISGRRIDFEKKPVKPKGANIGTVENFVKDVEDFCGRILRRFPKKAGRLSLLTHGLLREMSQEELRIVYEKFVRNVPFYMESLPTEWELRSAGRVTESIEGTMELINVNTSIKRVTGKMMESGGLQPLDRIQLYFDINTNQSNMDTRFNADAVKIFYAKAVALREKVLKEIEEYICA